MRKFKGKCFCGEPIAIKDVGGRISMLPNYRNMYLDISKDEEIEESKVEFDKKDKKKKRPKHKLVKKTVSRTHKVRVPVCADCFESESFDKEKAYEFWGEDIGVKHLKEEKFEIKGFKKYERI